MIEVSPNGMNVTSCVSDSAVSRLVRLYVETADGSGDVSVIREPYAGLWLCHMKKVFVFEFGDDFGSSGNVFLTVCLWLGSRRRR